MSQGNHTWKITHHYHKCPNCGGIFESRKDYEYCLGKYQKNVTCDRCHHAFTVTKEAKTIIGPLFGEGENVEVTWRS